MEDAAGSISQVVEGGQKVEEAPFEQGKVDERNVVVEEGGQGGEGQDEQGPVGEGAIDTEVNKLHDDDDEAKNEDEGLGASEEDGLLPKSDSTSKEPCDEGREITIWDWDDDSHECNHARAFYIAGIGVVFNLTMMTLTFLIGIATSSSMMLVIASQHFLDAAGDCLIMWRFWCDPNDPDNVRYDMQGSVMISLTALAACLYVFSIAVIKILQEVQPKWSVLGIVVASVIFVGASILGAIKIILAQKLDSRALHMDGITSMFVSGVALMYIASELLLHFAWSFWQFEHWAAIGLTAFLVLYAAYNLYASQYDGYKFYHIRFWRKEKLFSTPRFN